jgi:hypothetical protein
MGELPGRPVGSRFAAGSIVVEGKDRVIDGFGVAVK